MSTRPAGRWSCLLRGSRRVTYLQEGGRQIGALVHDAAVLDDPVLVNAVAAAAGVAVANARLQAEVRARVAEVEASRRRIVEAGDAERRRLERELREGAERRLVHVTELLADRGPPGRTSGGSCRGHVPPWPSSPAACTRGP